MQPAIAQIEADDTLGPTPSVLRDDTSTGQLLIEGGASRGSILFHSFSDFNIAADGNAYFVNPDSIDVIVSRVTGNRESNLLGTLGVLGEADFFFINPNGISFGENSTLDLQGSFVASTADGVVFDDDFTFSATEPEKLPLLTISAPTGLQFGQQPEPISFQSPGGFRIEGLLVQPGQTLALLGGELDLQGARLNAFGGRIELGSIAEAGTVDIISLGEGLTFNYDNISVFGNLRSSGSLVDTTVTNRDLTSLDVQNNGIVIQAADITLDSSSLILAGTLTDLRGGDVVVNVRRLELNSASGISSLSSSGFPEDIAGDAGNIVINASESISLNGGLDFGSLGVSTAFISTLTQGAGTDFFFDEFGNIVPSPRGNSFGNGGDILITTKELSITEGAFLTAASGSAGNAGNITINTSGAVQVSRPFIGENFFRAPGIRTDTAGTGMGGRILINSSQLLLQDAGLIASRTNGSDTGGVIEVNAKIIEVSGSVLIPELKNNSEAREIGSAVSTVTLAEGNAGRIRLDAEQVNLLNGGRITTATAPESSGNGNLLQVNASESIRIDGESSGLFSSSEGSGNAGEVRIDTEQLTISGNGEVSAATMSATAESSGSLNLNVNRLVLNNGNLTVETFAQGGRGAEISISGLEVLLLRNGSLISAEAINGANGGNIRIDAAEGFVVAPFEEDSDILARANLGDGGEIEIIAQSILGLEERIALPGNGTNDIDASSSFGASGTVVLNELEVNPAVEEAELPDNTGVPEIVQQCNLNQNVSSFIATGRSGVPPAPQATVPELLWQPSRSAAQGPSPPVTAVEQLVEAQGWQTNGAGQVVLTAASTETVPYATTSSVADCSLVRL